MSDEKRLVPRIRFPEFTDDWEQRKFGDVLQTLPFKAYLKSPEQDGRYEIIQQGSDPIIGYANGEPCKDYKNTVIFGDHTLSLYKPKKPFFVATDGVRIVKGFENMDGNYLLSLLERNKPQSEGYKRYYSILADIDVFFTENHEEQSKIGEYFSELDDLITLHQRECDTYKKMKKGMMQKLFNQEVRFKKNDGSDYADWYETTVQNVCTVKTGDSDTQDQVENGEYPFFIRSAEVKRSNRYLFDCEAVVTIGDGNIGKVFHYINGKFDLHQRCYVMYDFKDIHGKFFYYYFSKNFYRRAIRMSAKGTVDSVRRDMITEMPLFIPADIEEQIKIANCLTEFDNLIDASERRLEAVKLLKKAMLQKMFV